MSLLSFIITALAAPSAPPQIPKKWSSLIGIITAITGNILISIALNTQRYAHLRLQRKAKQSSSPSASASPYLRSPYWWAGLVLMLIGEIGNFLAYGFAPASIVSPLGVVALISNCVIAPVVLKEPFRRRDAFGVVIAILGAVIVALSAKLQEVKLGPDELWSAIARTEFIVYVAITVSAIVALMFASARYGDRSILIDLGLVALFGGYTALSTKGVSSLLSYRLWRVLTFPITYGLVIVLVVTALMQIRYLNRALQRFDSTQVIPTQFVLFTLSVITGSAVLYRDFEKATLESVIKFIAGCGLTFLGVYFITTGRDSMDHDDEEESSEEPSPEIEARADETTPLIREPTSPSPKTSQAETPFLLGPHDSSELVPTLLPPNTSSPSISRHSSHRSYSRDSITPNRRPSRRSISLVPGPLISPLSGSLSGVVADTLRRSIESTAPTRSRLQSSLRNNLFSSSTGNGGSSSRLSLRELWNFRSKKKKRSELDRNDDDRGDDDDVV
jgi:hypothetical protein